MSINYISTKKRLVYVVYSGSVVSVFLNPVGIAENVCRTLTITYKVDIIGRAGLCNSNRQ